MDKELSRRYQHLIDELKELFKKLAALQLDNERLAKENITLREEVSLLRLYIDTYQQEGEAAVAELAEMNLIPPISKDALEFYASLPQSFNFPELFELADLLGASVSLVSEPGRGATFFVDVPLTHQPDQPQPLMM